MAELTQEQTLWTKILRSYVKPRDPNSSVIFLGDPSCGKHAIVEELMKAAIEGDEPEYKESEILPSGRGPLDFTFCRVDDPEEKDMKGDDSAPVCGFWFLNSIEHRDLLQLAFQASSPKHLAFVFCVDGSKPWMIMQSLQNWMELLEEQWEIFTQNSILKQELCQVIESYYKSYHEANMPSARRSSALELIDANELDISLPEGTLTKNFGIPVIVVVSKSDMYSPISEQAHNFIQYHLRKFCLIYGGTLIHTSAKTGINCRELWHYLLHRIYHYSLHQPLQILDRSSIFVPFGTDSLTRIDDLMITGDKNARFEDVIKNPHAILDTFSARKSITIESDQEFLEFLKQKIEESQQGQKTDADMLQERQRVRAARMQEEIAEPLPALSKPETKTDKKKFEKNAKQFFEDLLSRDQKQRVQTLDKNSRRKAKEAKEALDELKHKRS